LHRRVHYRRCDRRSSECDIDRGDFGPPCFVDGDRASEPLVVQRTSKLMFHTFFKNVWSCTFLKSRRWESAGLSPIGEVAHQERDIRRTIAHSANVHSSGRGTGTVFPTVGGPRQAEVTEVAHRDAGKISQSPGCERLRSQRKRRDPNSIHRYTIFSNGEMIVEWLAFKPNGRPLSSLICKSHSNETTGEGRGCPLPVGDELRNHRSDEGIKGADSRLPADYQRTSAPTLPPCR
jgi:hypothetical protein